MDLSSNWRETCQAKYDDESDNLYKLAHYAFYSIGYTKTNQT